MPDFIIAYHGGKPPASPEEGERQMAKWKDWVMQLGDAVVNPGQPLKNARTVSAKKVTDGGGEDVMSGYSIVTAQNMDAALEMAKACPFLETGGTLKVAELVNMQA